MSTSFLSRCEAGMIEQARWRRGARARGTPGHREERVDRPLLNREPIKELLAGQDAPVISMPKRVLPCRPCRPAPQHAGRQHIFDEVSDRGRIERGARAELHSDAPVAGRARRRRPMAGLERAERSADGIPMPPPIGRVFGKRAAPRAFILEIARVVLVRVVPVRCTCRALKLDHSARAFAGSRLAERSGATVGELLSAQSARTHVHRPRGGDRRARAPANGAADRPRDQWARRAVGGGVIRNPAIALARSDARWW
jgi:hypothetical protein